MSREIKFRAWYPSRKKMGVPFDLHKELTSIPPEENIYDKFLSEAIFLQFTGLKDKHGNDIYEGDIVKHRNGAKPVAYDEASASFQMELSDSVLDQEICAYDDLEVIGNIYQNPELIKQAAT